MPETTTTPSVHDAAWRQAMTVQLDYNYVLDTMVGKDHGLKRADLVAMTPEVAKLHETIVGRTGAGKEYLGFLDLPHQPAAGLDKIKATGDRLAELGDRHIVLGIGGSYLGARALVEGLFSPYRNELSREDRGGRPRIYFEGNNLDADGMSALLDLCPDAHELGANDVTLEVISKSGGTIETAVAFRVFRQRLEQAYGKGASQRIVATTDAGKGALKALADAKGYETFVIPDDVGGRFSILTPVGLLPAAVAGVDLHALVAGAKHMAERCAGADLMTNPAYLYAAIMHLSYVSGRNISIMTAWSKCLEFVGFWYDQLAAESLGKDGTGRVPFTAVNTRDLHARGQQVQDGARNTVVTNLVVKASRRSIDVQPDAADTDGLNYLTGWTLDSMLAGAKSGTQFAYARDQRPSLDVVIPQVNAFTLGQLFYFFELATLAEGYLQKVNPLDQPGVEAYKKFMFGNLGRPDMANYKAEFDARPKPSAACLV